MKKIDIHMHCRTDDPLMDKYLLHMDKYDVQAGLVHAGPLPGEGNEAVLQAIKAHRDRLFGSIQVDLREPAGQCIELIRRYAGEGFKSIKLIPNLGFDPNDERLEPFWQVVEELGLLCLSHCGCLTMRDGFAKMRISSLTATPLHFEVPVRRHPEIKFIMAHFGGGVNYMETIVMMAKYKNVFADTCRNWGTRVFALRMPGLGYLDYSRLLYGTDNSGERYGQDEAWWIHMLRTMGQSDQAVEGYFYNNAAALLGIK